jgi:uncharacterized protein (TIGR04255 family)
MPNATGSSGHFDPVHSAHAIESVVLGVQFDRPLTDHAILQLQQACTSLSSELPGVAEIRGFGVSFGPQGVSPILQQSTNVPDGFARTRTAPNGAIEKELRIDRGGIVFRNSKYSRWNDVWVEAKNYISIILTAVDSEVKLSSYYLNYSDKFIWRGIESALEPKLLLQTDSPYLSPSIFTGEDLWHSHTGKFIRADPHVKRLQVVNSDCVEEPTNDGKTQRIVRVATVLTDMLNMPGFEPLSIEPKDALKFLDTRMNDLHTLLKSMFSEIVTQEVSNRIGLGDSNAAA